MALLAVLLIGFLDYATGPQISPAIIYLLPIALAAWFAGRFGGIVTALSSGIVWLVADLLTNQEYSHPTIPYWNSVMRIGFFWIVVQLLTTIKRLQENLEAMVQQKTAALQREMQERSRVEQAVLEISGQEQRRIAHDLHDELGQHLTYAALKAKMLAEDLAAASLPQALTAQEIVRVLNDGTQQVRRFARGLDPIDAVDSGLTAALERLAKETENVCHVKCGFTFDRANLPLEPTALLHLYRIAQEAVNNAIRHGKAESLDIELTSRSGEISLAIADRGIGFAPENTQRNGLGIRIMCYRARSLGGDLTITSAPNKGTKVQCVVPAAPSPETSDSSRATDLHENAKKAASDR